MITILSPALGYHLLTMSTHCCHAITHFQYKHVAHQSYTFPCRPFCWNNNLQGRLQLYTMSCFSLGAVSSVMPQLTAFVTFSWKIRQDTNHSNCCFLTFSFLPLSFHSQSTLPSSSCLCLFSCCSLLSSLTPCLLSLLFFLCPDLKAPHLQPFSPH